MSRSLPIDDIVAHAPAAPAGAQRFAGLDLSRPLLMGVVNVTPDSFSDGGDHLDPAAAIAHGRHLLAEGADIIDIGGESTRPGASPTATEEELARVLPVVEALARAGALVSIDTRRAQVMRAALAAGAKIVNDVTALTFDPDSLAAVRDGDASVVLMHMQGEPGTMQLAPSYADAKREVFAFLEERVAACLGAGIARERIAVDPGIGFGKTLAHNLDLLAGLGSLKRLGVAVLVGVSRKSFIARLSLEEAPKARLGGSLAGALAACARGANILRVHDVAQTRQALAVWGAIAAAADRPLVID